MIRTTVAALALITAQAAGAETIWLSDPSICGASDVALEESDAIFLYAASVENHVFGCGFDRAWQPEVERNGSVILEATCANGSGEWTARFEMVRRGEAAVAVYQETGGLSPVVFHRCTR